MTSGGCGASALVPRAIEFIDAAPAYACVGFEWPLDHGPVTVRGNLGVCRSRPICSTRTAPS